MVIESKVIFSSSLSLPKLCLKYLHYLINSIKCGGMSAVYISRNV